MQVQSNTFRRGTAWIRPESSILSTRSPPLLSILTIFVVGGLTYEIFTSNIFVLL